MSDRDSKVLLDLADKLDNLRKGKYPPEDDEDTHFFLVSDTVLMEISRTLRKYAYDQGCNTLNG